ncbi:TRAP transporter large permease subunit [Chloroflexota bacterium]
MEWQLTLLLIACSFLILITTGLPIAFCFLLVNFVGAYLVFGGMIGIEQLVVSIYKSVSYFALVPVVLFVLMGEVMFQSGIAPSMIDAIGKAMGRLPGRLSLIAVGGGAIFATLTGSSVASVALLGSTLVPEMEKRGYKKPMTLGPILGSGGLAIMIPPSGLAILLGAIARISLGKLLVAIVIPGFVMASLYAIYIIARCKFQPSIAPAYSVTSFPLSKKVEALVRYVMPLGSILFMVLGFIFLGIATPSEAAATGALGTFILAAAYRRLSWDVIKKSIGGTFRIAVMLLMILTGAQAFSEIMALSGASRGLTEFAVSLPLAPILILIAMQFTLLIMGTFIDCVAMVMLTMPIFMPLVLALGFNPVWFGVIVLLNMEMAETTPPYGLTLFVMKGVAPTGTTMGDIYRAGLPFLGCDLIVMILLMVFPTLALWLPGLMH